MYVFMSSEGAELQQCNSKPNASQFKPIKPYSNTVCLSVL